MEISSIHIVFVKLFSILIPTITFRGVPRILPGGMHRIKILSWIRIRILIRIETMRIHSPGLNCQKIVV
jgi:hypothetical protein